MAIYDNLPYTDFHELNAAWLLKQMKAAKAKVDSMQAEINQFNEDYAALAALFTISGNNVSIPGTMTANGFIGNLTGNADSATNAAVANRTLLDTTVNSTDANDYMPSADGMAIFKTGALSTHIMSSLTGEYFIIIAVKEGSRGWQIAYCPYGSSDIFFRTKFSSWTNWMKITATTAS